MLKFLKNGQTEQLADVLAPIKNWEKPLVCLSLRLDAGECRE